MSICLSFRLSVNLSCQSISAALRRSHIILSCLGWLESDESMIPDPTAEKPVDWDDEMDGDWEAPLLENPACKDAPGCGPWTAPTIDNPAFKGKWRAPLIANPAYKVQFQGTCLYSGHHDELKDLFSMSILGFLSLPTVRFIFTVFSRSTPFFRESGSRRRSRTPDISKSRTLSSASLPSAPSDSSCGR